MPPKTTKTLRNWLNHIGADNLTEEVLGQTRVRQQTAHGERLLRRNLRRATGGMARP